MLHARKLTWNLKWWFFIGISSSRGSFSGSMLVFGGVSHTVSFWGCWRDLHSSTMIDHVKWLAGIFGINQLRTWPMVNKWWCCFLFKLKARVFIRFFPMHLNDRWISLVMFGTYPPVGDGEKNATYWDRWNKQWQSCKMKPLVDQLKQNH